MRWGLPTITWVVLVVGASLLIAAWILIPALGNGVPEPWRWSSSSWQAVTAAMVGWSLVVFASLTWAAHVRQTELLLAQVITMQGIASDAVIARTLGR